MCQICERVTLARLSCPERSRPKDGVSPIVVVVPVAELAACSDGKLSHGWCWCASGERNNIVQLQLDHVSCTELLSLSMQRLRYDILNWWWRPLGHQAVIDWRTEEWGTQGLNFWFGLAWPIGLLLDAAGSQVSGPRPETRSPGREGWSYTGGRCSDFEWGQTSPALSKHGALGFIWIYDIIELLWCSEIASKSTQKRKNI